MTRDNKPKRDIFSEEFLVDEEKAIDIRIASTDNEEDTPDVSDFEMSEGGLPPEKQPKVRKRLFTRKEQENSLKLEKQKLDIREPKAKGETDWQSPDFDIHKGDEDRELTAEDLALVNMVDNLNEQGVDDSSEELGDTKKKGRFGKGKKSKGKKGKVKPVETVPQSITFDGELNDESISLDEIENQEKMRQRRELALAKVELKKADRREFINSFATAKTLTSYAIYVVAGATFLTWLNNVFIVSLILALIGAIPMTYWFTYRKAQLAVVQQELLDLANMASQISFHMQNGKNIADTLDYLRDDFGGRVGAEINFTYAKLMADGELITSNFDKFEFTAFNVFARNLQIAYHDGIEPKKLFKSALNNINFEWVERSNLMIMNNQQAMLEYQGVALGILITSSLRMAANTVYMDFLGYPQAAVIMSLVVFFGLIKVATGVKRVSMDVSVNV